jgi:hypothetical protein
MVWLLSDSSAVARTATGGGRCSLHPVEPGSAGLVTTHRATNVRFVPFRNDSRPCDRRQSEDGPPCMCMDAVAMLSVLNNSHFGSSASTPGTDVVLRRHVHATGGRTSVASSDRCTSDSRCIERASPAPIHVSARRTYCTSVAPWLVSQFGHTGHSSSISSAPSLMLTTARRRHCRCPAAFRSPCTPQLMQYSPSSNSGSARTKFVTVSSHNFVGNRLHVDGEVLRKVATSR